MVYHMMGGNRLEIYRSEMESDLVYFSSCQVKFRASVNCNSTKATLFVSALVESQLHNITTPICLAGVNPTKEFQPLITPW